MLPNDERKKKEDLFGSTGIAPLSGVHAVDQKRLLESLEWAEGVARVFCRRCGETMEINTRLAKKMAEKSGETPASFEGKYFQVEGCILCLREYKDPSIKQIPSF